MPRTRASVSGQAGLTRALRRAAQDVQDGAVSGQRVAAQAVAADWRRSVPVDEGEYRDSVDFDADGAFATAEHSPFVEFGTSTHVAQPAGTEAAERARARVPGQVADEIKRRLP